MAQEGTTGGKTPENRSHGKPFALIFGWRRTTTIFADGWESTDEHQTDWISVERGFFGGEFSAYTKLKLVRWAGEYMDGYTSKIQWSWDGDKTGVCDRVPKWHLNGIVTCTSHQNIVHGRFAGTGKGADERYGQRYGHNHTVPLKWGWSFFWGKTLNWIGITCYRCSGQGYMTRELCNKMAWWLHSEMWCLNCNKIDHFASECWGNSLGKDVSTSKKWDASCHLCTCWQMTMHGPNWHQVFQDTDEHIGMLLVEMLECWCINCRWKDSEVPRNQWSWARSRPTCTLFIWRS